MRWILLNILVIYWMDYQIYLFLTFTNVIRQIATLFPNLYSNSSKIRCGILDGNDIKETILFTFFTEVDNTSNDSIPTQLLFSNPSLILEGRILNRIELFCN